MAQGLIELFQLDDDTAILTLLFHGDAEILGKWSRATCCDFCFQGLCAWTMHVGLADSGITTTFE